MICQKCNFQNEDSAKFCRSCGASIQFAPTPNKTQPIPAPTETNSNAGTWVMSILFVLAALGVFTFTWTQYEELDAAHDRIYDELLEVQNELHEIQKKYDDLRETFPLKITRIELANSIIDDYGSTLYSSRLRFLTPKIHFNNYLKEGKTFNFSIHYIDAWGKMEYNTTNGKIPASEVYISTTDKSARLSGWGTASGGYWKSGKWTVEIWCNGVCLGSEKFTIY